MKHSLEEIETKPKFKPIRLVIEIESEEELKELWHRFNICPEDIKDAYLNSYRNESVGKFGPTIMPRIWSLLNDKAIELRIRKL